jgi:cytochrome c5
MAGEEEMKIRISALMVMVLGISGALFSASKLVASDQASDQSNNKANAQTSNQAKTSQSKAPIDYQAEGDRIFTANCSRCHMAPMIIPPRITGTVIAHMRVRARLSKYEQDVLLKFMAP